jgi:hypothetical protein
MPSLSESNNYCDECGQRVPEIDLWRAGSGSLERKGHADCLIAMIDRWAGSDTDSLAVRGFERRG